MKPSAHAIRRRRLMAACKGIRFFLDGISGSLLRLDKHYKKIACPHAANLKHGCMLELVAVAEKKWRPFRALTACGQGHAARGGLNEKRHSRSVSFMT
jgi:hypothetical protein